MMITVPARSGRPRTRSGTDAEACRCSVTPAVAPYQSPPAPGDARGGDSCGVHTGGGGSGDTAARRSIRACASCHSWTSSRFSCVGLPCSEARPSSLTISSANCAHTESGSSGCVIELRCVRSRASISLKRSSGRRDGSGGGDRPLALRASAYQLLTKKRFCRTGVGTRLSVTAAMACAAVCSERSGSVSTASELPPVRPSSMDSRDAVSRGVGAGRGVRAATRAGCSRGGGATAPRAAAGGAMATTRPATAVWLTASRGQSSSPAHASKLCPHA
eukprot:scaffold8889_cov100-Isochrysis_galbana.AAC.4